MLYELRLSVQDRPGSLARLTRLLADRSIDVREIDILGNIVGQAVDILFLDCTQDQATTLAPQLEGLDGFELLSLRPANLRRTSHPELDLLLTLSRPGNEAIGAFTEASVPAFSADWAAAFAIGRGARPEAATAGAPDLLWNGWAPKRATRVLPGVYSGDAAPFEAIHAPFGDRHILLLGRSPGPAFHELEVMRFNKLLEVASTFVGAAASVSLFGAGSPVGRL
ncbi:MAG: hypothetical protein QOF57_417 [Frankiaceae bacterium]|jgi:acetolactate synthase regulatory subunit|nr:hypothetical protein [Frankiaceae bacterium]